MEQFGTDFSEKLSERQIETLPHLLKPGSLSQQAKNAGVGRTTLYRWLEDDNFRNAVTQLREITMQIAESEILAMSYEAAAVIYDALKGEDKNARFKAAQIVLQHAHNAQYGRDLEKRVEMIADALKLAKEAAWQTHT